MFSLQVGIWFGVSSYNDLVSFVSFMPVRILIHKMSPSEDVTSLEKINLQSNGFISGCKLAQNYFVIKSSQSITDSSAISRWMNDWYYQSMQSTLTLLKFKLPVFLCHFLITNKPSQMFKQNRNIKCLSQYSFSMKDVMLVYLCNCFI